MFAFLLHLLIENFKPESYCFKRNNRICRLNCNNFESYQTTFHKKNYHKRLFNSTTLFVVYKWHLRIETVVIKLNEIKAPEVLFSEFCNILRENIDKSKLIHRVVKFFQSHIRNSFSSPTMVRCFAFQGPGFPVSLRSRSPVFKFFVGSQQVPTRSWVPVFQFFQGPASVPPGSQVLVLEFFQGPGSRIFRYVKKIHKQSKLKESLNEKDYFLSPYCHLLSISKTFPQFIIQ